MLKAVKSKINRAETVAASPRLSKTRGVCSGLRYANISYSDIHFDLDNSFAWCKCFCSRTRDHTRPIPPPTTQTYAYSLLMSIFETLHLPRLTHQTYLILIHTLTYASSAAHAPNTSTRSSRSSLFLSRYYRSFPGPGVP